MSDDIARKFVNAIIGLSKSNRLTGIWDNRRFQECKKNFTDIDCEYVYKTEKLSRRSVEERAAHKTQIDVLFEKLINAK
jgi:hypothetical protein